MRSLWYTLFIILPVAILITVSVNFYSYAVHELFKSIDENADGKINQEEFSEDMTEKYSNVHEAFMGLDKDGSNNLSPDQITVRPLFKMVMIKIR